MSRRCGRKACAAWTTYDPAGYCFPATVKAASDELLRGATVGQVEGVQCNFERAELAQRERASHPHVPGGKPRSPQLAVATVRVGKAQRGGERIGNRASGDRDRKMSAQPRG